MNSKLKKFLPFILLGLILIAIILVLILLPKSSPKSGGSGPTPKPGNPSVDFKILNGITNIAGIPDKPVVYSVNDSNGKEAMRLEIMQAENPNEVTPHGISIPYGGSFNITRNSVKSDSITTSWSYDSIQSFVNKNNSLVYIIADFGDKLYFNEKPVPGEKTAAVPDWAMKIKFYGVSFQDVIVTVYDKDKNIYKNQNTFPDDTIEYWYIPEDGGSITFKSVWSTDANPQKTYSVSYLKKAGISNLVLNYDRSSNIISFSK